MLQVVTDFADEVETGLLTFFHAPRLSGWIPPNVNVIVVGKVLTGGNQLQQQYRKRIYEYTIAKDGVP